MVVRLLVLHDMLVEHEVVVDEVENDVHEVLPVHDNEMMVDNDVLQCEVEVDDGVVLDVNEQAQQHEVMVDADIIVRFLESDIGMRTDEVDEVVVQDEYDIVEVVVERNMCLQHLLHKIDKHIEADEVERVPHLQLADVRECLLSDIHVLVDMI